MIFFNPEVFSINENLNFDEIETDSERVFVVDNFYKDIESVYNEIQKLPLALVWKEFERKELENIIIDGRKTYCSNMVGTTLPYLNQLPSVIEKNIKIKEEQFQIQDSLIINCCKKLLNYPDDKYYNVHKDKSEFYDACYQFSIVVFLNKQYHDETVGINIYRCSENTNYLNKFIDKDKLDLVHFIKAKSNRAVIIPQNVLHGQENGNGSQFYEEWRYTQVIFVPIFNPIIVNKNQKLNYS